MPAVLNAANEMAVEQFLKEKISFQEIPTCISKACESHMENLNLRPELEDILEETIGPDFLLSKKLKKGKNT